MPVRTTSQLSVPGVITGGIRVGSCRRGTSSCTGMGDTRRKVEARSQERESWDLGRFAQTIAFFNAPSSGDIVGSAIRMMARPFQPRAFKAYQTWIGDQADKRSATLVTDATSATARQTVAALLSAGQRVRVLYHGDSEPLRQALVANAKLADPCAVLEAGKCDPEAAPSLELMHSVRTVIDTSPKGSSQLQLLLRQHAGQLGAADTVKLLDPNGEGSAGPAAWGALDDVVMGGVSKSGLYAMPGGGPSGENVLVFRGNVSESNSGGFASVRSRNYEPPLDLSGADGLRMRVRGDGKRYKLTLRTSTGWDTTGYTAGMDTPVGEWTTVDIPFTQFIPIFRAKRQSNAPPLDQAHVASLQIMLSKFEHDGDLNPTFEPGAFQLPILSVSCYAARSSPPRLIKVSSDVAAADAQQLLRESGLPAAVVNVGDASPDSKEAAWQHHLASLLAFMCSSPSASGQVVHFEGDGNDGDAEWEKVVQSSSCI